MSGVQTGSRLDRLLNLRRAATLQHRLATRADRHSDVARLALLLEAVNEQIRHEAASIAAEARRRPTVAAAVRSADQTVEERLRAMDVTTHTVKAWAVQQGLIPALVRGRVAGALVDAYEAAFNTTHQEPHP